MAIPLLAGATAIGGIVKGIGGIIQGARQKKEAKKQKRLADLAKKDRDTRLDTVESEAEQRAGATRAPGMAEAEEALDRNVATATSAITRGTTSSANALNAAAMANQQKNQASLQLAGQNQQYQDVQRQNLQNVRGQRAQVAESDRQETQGRSDAFAGAGDQNIMNAINAPLTTAMVLGQMSGGNGTGGGLFGNLFGGSGNANTGTGNPMATAGNVTARRTY